MYFLFYLYLRFFLIISFAVALNIGAGPHAVWGFGIAALVAGGTLVLDVWEWTQPPAKPLRQEVVEEFPHLTGFIGDLKQFKEYFAGDIEGEHLVGSSIQAPNGTIYAIMQPGRHHHVHALMEQNGCTYEEMSSNNGFLTNEGKHVSRREGLKIASAAEQVRGGKTIGSVLTSEDLW